MYIFPMLFKFWSNIISVCCVLFVIFYSLFYFFTVRIINNLLISWNPQNDHKSQYHLSTTVAISNPPTSFPLNFSFTISAGRVCKKREAPKVKTQTQMS